MTCPAARQRTPGRYLEDGRLHFDFKLREGVVERSNALD